MLPEKSFSRKPIEDFSDLSSLSITAPIADLDFPFDSESASKPKYSHSSISDEATLSIPIDQSSLYADRILKVATALSKDLLGDAKLDLNRAKHLMIRAFGGLDSTGTWQWKDLYEAQEVAFIQLLNGERAKQRLSLPPIYGLWWTHQTLDKTLTQTKRTEESVRMQQFSTPPPLAYLAALCAGVTDRDIVLEPSAGTGLLAKFTTLK